MILADLLDHTSGEGQYRGDLYAGKPLPKVKADARMVGLLRKACELHPPIANLPTAGGVVDVQRFRVLDKVGAAMPYPVVLMNLEDGISILVPKEGDNSGVKIKKGMPDLLGPGKASKESLVVSVFNAKTHQISHEVISIRGFAPAIFKDLGEGGSSGASNLSSVAQMAASVTDIPVIAANVDGIVHSPAIPSFFSLQDNKPDGGLQNGFGLVSTSGIGTGVLRYITAADQLAEAKRINDVGGAQIARIRRVRGVFEVSSTIVGGPLRTLCTPHLATAAVISHVSLKVLTNVARGLGTAYGILVAAPIIWNAIKASRFASNLEQVVQGQTTDKNKALVGLRHLMNQLVLNDKEKMNAVACITPKDAGQLYKMVSEKVVLDQDEAEILTYDDKVEINRLVDSVFLDLQTGNPHSLISNWGQVRANLSVRLMKEWAHCKMVRKAKYLRRASGESYELLRKELARPESYRLINRLKDPVMLAKAQEVVTVALAEAHTNTKVAVFLAATFALGLTSMALMSIFSGGVPIAIALVLGLLSNLMGTGLDVVAFINELQQMKDSGPKDRLILVAFAAIAVFAMVMGALQSGGAIPLAVVIIGGVTMLLMHAAAIRASFQAEAQAKERREVEALERKRFVGYTRKELEMFE